MNAEAVLRQLYELLNQQKWREASRLLSGTVFYNDTPVSGEACIELLRNEAESSSAVLWRLDALVHDRDTGQIGARVIVTAHAKNEESEGSPDIVLCRPFEYPQHLVVDLQDGKISKIKAITDVDVMDKQVERIECSPPSSGTNAAPGPRPNLTEFYTSYIRCINERTMKTELHKYCHPHVMWCGRKLPLDEYRGLMEGSFEAIDGLTFDVRDLIVDDERQQIFSRIEFTGTPVRSYSGVEPNGSSVRFAEHAMYWLEEGKIARVVTVIDWRSYRKQLSS